MGLTEQSHTLSHNHPITRDKEKNVGRVAVWFIVATFHGEWEIHGTEDFLYGLVLSGPSVMSLLSHTPFEVHGGVCGRRLTPNFLW